MVPGLDHGGGSPRPVSVKGPRHLKEILLNPGPFYSGRVASLGSRWRAPLVLVMAGRRSPSVLLSLRVCIYTYMYTYTSRQAVVPCFLSLSVSPISLLPFFLLHWGSLRRSPKGSTRRSADGLPNEHPTDHQTEINRSRRRPPNRSPNGHQQITQTTTRRSPKRSPNIPPNGPPRSHTTDDNPAIQKTTQETTKRSPKRSPNRSTKRSPKRSHKRSPNTSPTF